MNSRQRRKIEAEKHNTQRLEDRKPLKRVMTSGRKSIIPLLLMATTSLSFDTSMKSKCYY